MKTLVLIRPVHPWYVGFRGFLGTGVPPVGLGIIAALTPKDWQVKIIDEEFAPFQYVEADLVGITAITNVAPRAYEIARVYREKGITTVMGGIHASMLPDEALQHVDSVVIGEAENVWGTLIADFEGGRLQKTYSGGFPELAGSPIPRYDLFPRASVVAVQTTRGCPLACEYCSVTAFNGGRYRSRPIEEVVDELERVPGRRLFFLDDNIVPPGHAQRDRAMQLFEAMIRRKVNKRWVAQASINFADDEEVVKCAVRAGCRVVMIGVEAEDPDALREMNKSLNLRALGGSAYGDAFRRIQRQGILVNGFFMYGLDVDTPESLRNRSRFINACGVNTAIISIVCPFPGTKMGERMRCEGRLRYTNFPDDWGHYHFGEVAFLPKLMTPEVLEQAVHQAYRDVLGRRVIVSRFFRTWRATRCFPLALVGLAGNARQRVLRQTMVRKLRERKASASSTGN